MSERKFPIFDAAVPPMIGREEIMQRILGAVAKARPNHLQIVGPRYSGKSVILRELVTRLRARNAFTAIVEWDLAVQAPTSDEFFMQRLARELSNALRQSHREYSEHLNDAAGNPHHEISEVLDLLKEDGARVLVILDGFDRLLTRGRLTRNLWDQLREHASRPSLCLVTASQRSLRELIRDPDTQSSPFFNIFEMVRIPCFDNADLSAALKIMNFRFAAGAVSELWNAANGFPLMTLEVLNSLSRYVAGDEAHQQSVVDASETAYQHLKERIGALWSDCTASARDLMRRVLEEGVVVRGKGIANADVETLLDRGFIGQDGNKLIRPSRLLRRYLGEQPSEDSALVSLFSAPESYRRYLASVLERRILQIQGIDADLKRYLESGVRDLPDHPGELLNRVNGPLDRVLTLIWRAECWNAEGNKPHIPSEWFSTWKECGEVGFEKWFARFPESGARLHLLDLITGTRSTDRLSRYVTKNTYVLANALLEFRNFGIHPKDTDVDVGAAYVALHACIELAAVVTRELRPANAQLVHQR